MGKTRSSTWVWTVGGLLVGLVLHGAAGWWAAPGLAQGGNVTATTSTTTSTHFLSPPDCDPVGSSSDSTTVTTQTVFGPATILIGEDQSETFFVAAGTMNINTNVHTATFVCVAAVPALPWPALLGSGLLTGGLAAWRLRPSRRVRRHRQVSA